MRVFRTLVPVLIALFASATVSFAAFTTANAHLSRDQEIPQCANADTNGQGQALFRLIVDGTELTYTLIVANIDEVTVAHIHLIEGNNVGRPVVFLLNPQAPSGRVDGPLVSGTITEADLVGPLAGQPLSALVAALEAGTTYVNVHTADCPPGEIRGEIIVPESK